MIYLIAEIYLLTKEEGGMNKDGFSGMRPNFGLGGTLTTSEFVSVDGGLTVFPRGSWSQVLIRLPYGENLGSAICPGAGFTINLGGWEIGRGTIVKTMESSLSTDTPPCLP